MCLSVAVATISCASLSADLTVAKTAYSFSYEDPDGYYFTNCSPTLVSNIVAWGSGGLATAPGFCSGAVALSGGYDHCSAILSNGTVVSWGNLGYGEGAVPNDLIGSNATQIVAGKRWSAVLLGDGNGLLWGYFGGVTNTFGVTNALPMVQLDGTEADALNAVLNDGSVITYTPTGTVTYAASSAIGMSSQPARYIALKSDNTVFPWGGTATNISAHATNVVLVAAGSQQHAVLRGDGSIVYWNPTSAAAGTVRTTGHVGMSAYGANLWALNSTNGPVKYLGSIASPPAGTVLQKICVGNGYIIGIK